MQTFSQTVEAWHDFYRVMGGAAAALMGLLFVSLSLNAGLIMRREDARLRALAGQTFVNFMLVLMFAALVLIPHQGPLGLGLPLLAIDLAGLYVTGRRFLQMRRDPPRAGWRGPLLRRFVIPGICFITVLCVSISILLGATAGLYWLVPVSVLLIFQGLLNAWDLLLRLRRRRPTLGG
jgi:modulator of FtsH protease